jgi:chemotaxis protein MotA
MPELEKSDKHAVRKRGGKVDLATIAGLFVAAGGILGGLIIEGGKVRDIAQYTAAMIVLGGTIGAVLVSMPVNILKGAVRRLKSVVVDSTPPLNLLIDEVIAYATSARKNGLVSLEDAALKVEDPFLRKALNLAVDGTDLQEIRKMLEMEIGIAEHHAEADAKVFEAAGGYAPTIGIIGAVLGLIQVMKNLSNIDEVGHGIAAAFVATVYGVGVANLIFLPAATKIKARASAEAQRKEVIVEGVSGIVEGLNPKLIRAKLEAYTQDTPVKVKKGQARAGAAESLEKHGAQEKTA